MGTKLKKWKPAVSFLSLILGVSMLVSSVPRLFASVESGDAAVILNMRHFTETDEFAYCMSAYLQDFMNMGAGELVGTYNQNSVFRDYGGYYIRSSTNDPHAAASEVGTAVQTYLAPEVVFSVRNKISAPLEVVWDDAANAVTPEVAQKVFYGDKNVLYRISREGKVVYSNLDMEDTPDRQEYGVQIHFDGKETSVLRGEESILAQDRYMEANEPWDVPGYPNRPADERYRDVNVEIWVKTEPVVWKTDTEFEPLNVLYHLQSDITRQRSALYTQCIFFVLGAGLIGLAIGWSKERQDIVRRMARLTGKLPFEIKLLALLAVAFLMVSYSRSLYYWEWILNGFSLSEAFQEMGYVWQDSIRSLGNNADILLTGIWTLYFFINDCRLNTKTYQNSFCYKTVHHIRAKELKLPIQQRMNRRDNVLYLAVLTLVLSAAFWAAWVYWGQDSRAVLTVLMVVTLLLGAALLLSVRHRREVIHDIGALVDQIAAVRGGALASGLAMPQDADLAAAARDLDDIRSGMRAAVEEQMKSERMKVELITNVSHDIKTPLTSIISYVDLLKQEEGLPEHIQDYLNVLDRKSQRLRTMVRDVVEVSKAASGQLPLQNETLDLAKLLRQTLADMQERVADAPITVREDLPEEPCYICADGDKLYRVFQNLLQNALQYSLSGSRVYIALRIEGGEACVSIQNVAAQELFAGFDFTERFVRGDASRTDGGSGLGLSIASSFTQACGGRLSIETVGDLFTAIVCFPVIEG